METKYNVQRFFIIGFTVILNVFWIIMIVFIYCFLRFVIVYEDMLFRMDYVSRDSLFMLSMNYKLIGLLILWILYL